VFCSGLKESSVGKNHGQLTDDGTHSHMCLPLVDAAGATSLIVPFTPTLAHGYGAQSCLVRGLLLVQHQHIHFRAVSHPAWILNTLDRSLLHTNDQKY
jgi:hypothetical protein